MIALIECAQRQLVECFLKRIREKSQTMFARVIIIICIVLLLLRRSDCVTVSCNSKPYLSGCYQSIYTATQGQLLKYSVKTAQEIERTIQQDTAITIHSIHSHRDRPTAIDYYFVIWRKERSASTYWAIIGRDIGCKKTSDPMRIHFHGDITVIAPFAITLPQIGNGDVFIERVVIPARPELSLGCERLTARDIDSDLSHADAISVLEKQKIEFQAEVANLTAEIESRQQIVSDTQNKIDCLEQEHLYASREWKTQKMKLKVKLERKQKIANQTEEENKALRKRLNDTQQSAQKGLTEMMSNNNKTVNLLQNKIIEITIKLASVRKNQDYGQLNQIAEQKSNESDLLQDAQRELISLKTEKTIYIMIIAVICIVCVIIAVLWCRSCKNAQLYRLQQMHKYVKNNKPPNDAIKVHSQDLQIIAQNGDEGKDLYCTKWDPEKFSDVLNNSQVAQEVLVDDIVNDIETEGEKATTNDNQCGV